MANYTERCADDGRCYGIDEILNKVFSTNDEALQAVETFGNDEILNLIYDTSNNALRVNIINGGGESGSTTFLGLTDTPSQYNSGRILFENANAVTDSSNLTFDSTNNILSIGENSLKIQYDSTNQKGIINLTDNNTIEFNIANTKVIDISNETLNVWGDIYTRSIWFANNQDLNQGFDFHIAERKDNTQRVVFYGKPDRFNIVGFTLSPFQVNAPVRSFLELWTRNFDTTEDTTNGSWGGIMLEDTQQLRLYLGLGTDILIQPQRKVGIAEKNYALKWTPQKLLDIKGGIVVGNGSNLDPEGGYFIWRPNDSTPRSVALVENNINLAFGDINWNEINFSLGGVTKNIRFQKNKIGIGNINDYASLNIETSTPSIRLNNFNTFSNWLTLGGVGNPNWQVNWNPFDDSQEDTSLSSWTMRMRVSYGDDFSILYNQAGGNSTTWTEYFTILNNGNVGIGTNNPSSKLQVGEAGDGSFALANDWQTFSDIRLKKNISQLNYGLNEIKNLVPIKFKYKKEYKNSKFKIGLIAQEIEKVIPEIVYKNNKGYKSIAYDKLVVVLINAIKELDKKLKKLEKEISLMKKDYKLIY